MGSACGSLSHRQVVEEFSESLDVLLDPELQRSYGLPKRVQDKSVKFASSKLDTYGDEPATTPTMENAGLEGLESLALSLVSDLPATPPRQAWGLHDVNLVEVSKDVHGKNELAALVEKLKAAEQLIDISEVTTTRVLCETYKSTVLLGQWQHRAVALKLINQHLVSRDEPSAKEVREISKQEMLRELQILSGLKHPCLVSLLGAGISDEQCFMMTEYMECGDVEAYMEDGRARALTRTYKPPVSLGLQWCISTAKALSFLHGQECQIIHRDLKPLNLLLSRNLELKVTDFGISKVIPHRDTQPAPQMSGGVGTWRYMAPEVVRYEQYTDRIDVYSLSLIMCFIFTGKQPFHDFCKNDTELILKAYIAGQEPRPTLDSSIHPGLRQLMQESWSVKASSRPSSEQCLERLEKIELPRGKSSLFVKAFRSE